MDYYKSPRYSIRDMREIVEMERRNQFLADFVLVLGGILIALLLYWIN